MIVAALLCVWIATISWFDWRKWRVPNAALILVLVPAILALVFQGQGLLGERWLSSLGGMALGFALTFPGYLTRRFGAGDVKFAAVLGLLLGVARGFEMVLVASLLMGAVALALLKLQLSRHTKFPAAPLLSAAFVLEMTMGPLLRF